jgi:hypothetical protein
VSTLVSINPNGTTTADPVTITATGTGFTAGDPVGPPVVPASQLTFDGSPVTTTFVNATTLTTEFTPTAVQTIVVGVSDGTGTADFNAGLPDDSPGTIVEGGDHSFVANSGAVATMVGTLGAGA